MTDATPSDGDGPVDLIRKSHSPTLRAPSWDKMPSEVISNIMQYLSRNDLKACRQVEKRTGAEATRVLFRTIIFAPSMTSVDKINKIAHDPRFACYVQFMEIHRFPLRRSMFEKVLEPSLKSLAGTEAYSRMEKAFQNEKDASAQFLGHESPLQASELWQKFSQLRHIFFTNTSIPGEGSDAFFLNGELEEESDLFRLCGVRLLHDRSYYHDEGGYLDLLLATKYLQHLRPRVLEIPSVHWQDFSRRFTLDRTDRNAILPMHSEVERFKLTFRNWFPFSGGVNELWEFTMSQWRDLSLVFPKLQDLWLGFAKPPSASTAKSPNGSDFYTVPAAIIQSLLYPRYSQLASLTLENVCITLPDLQDFIRRHATRLKTIHLKNLRFDEVPHHNNKILGSIMKLIFFLRKETSLDAMSFEGTFFHNQENDKTTLRCGHGSRNCLRSQVESYICHKRNFPFQVLQPYLKDLTEGHFKVSECGIRIVIGFELDNDAGIEIRPGTDGSWIHV